MSKTNSSPRLMSIDVLRGFDMFWIVGGALFMRALSRAMTGGCTGVLYRQFTHVAWEGLHAFDLIFPVFLFIAGLSYPFSHAGQVARGASSWQMHRKILVRVIALIALGCLYNGFLWCDRGEIPHFRYVSVLGKIGFVWGIAALIYLHSTWRSRLVWCVAGLIGYAALLTVVAPDAPAGAGPTSLEGCFVGYLDRLFTPGHLYCKNLMDPSGPFVSFFGYPTALFGMCAGDLVRSERFAPVRKVLLLALAGAVALAAGLIVSPFCPVIKSLWTPSFSLVAAGVGFLLFALFHLLVDVFGWTRWCFAFRLIGMNAIAIYLLRTFVDFGRPSRYFFGLLASFAGPYQAAVLMAGEIAVELFLLNLLYRHKIFFKV